MPGCVIGECVTIFPNAVLYEDSIVGDRCIIHSNAVIGSYGFGYSTVDGQHHLSAQLGYVEIGSDVEVGACSTIDRGTYGPTLIGEGTKIDNHVMIAHNCRIGKYNILCSQVGIAGSCTTGDYVMMGGQVGVADHNNIGHHVSIGAQTGVFKDIPDGESHFGSPSSPIREQAKKYSAFDRLPEMRQQFREMQRRLASLLLQIEASDKKDAA
ncbi:MAG: UDP-3-O-(3-hydroxymyristoyl)glucosamine N-acyltransferase [Planctomycetes bacterium]|nr:UDP-3-O-(3-hydroxymyristoyl)glucosamine N-acyltransferase [Planctomycetota bacterium]